MRETCLRTVYELAQADERVFFVGSDLGAGVMRDFRRDFPNRFFMEGISEANVVGLSAGLAMEGQIVYVNTIATFLTRRCYDQVAVDLCMHNANVRLLASGGGLVYAPLGPTHLAIEDLAIMRTLPNMTVLAPADAVEMRRMMFATLTHEWPIYVRIAKGYDKVVTCDTGPFVIGKASPMREGGDVLLICTGVALQVCLAAAEQLAVQGVEAAVLHLPTVKPLDAEAILNHVGRAPAVLTVEEHVLAGGLGSAVLELLAETDLLNGRRFGRIGIPDVFADQYGDQHGLMKKYGISPENVAAKAIALLTSKGERPARAA